MNTDKSPEEIVNILRTFTYGFNPNIYRFNLEEYKKALADRDPNVYDERFGYATPFSVAQEEFIDKNDKLACAKVLVRNLWWEEDGIIKKFCDYIGHPYDPEMWSVTLVENISDYNINSENAEKVLKWFKDNNLAERTIRKLTAQRNNSLHYENDADIEMVGKHPILTYCSKE